MKIAVNELELRSDDRSVGVYTEANSALLAVSHLLVLLVLEVKLLRIAPLLNRILARRGTPGVLIRRLPSRRTVKHKQDLQLFFCAKSKTILMYGR